MPKVAYIISAGHSGSTLLDLLIGSIPGAFSTGELVHLPWQVYRDGKMCELGQDICTCGKTFKTCEVWGAVLDQISAQKGYDIKEDPLRFSFKVMAPRHYAASSPLLHRVLRKIYFKTRNTGAADLMLAGYRECARNSQLVYDSLHTVTGAEVIVDSSKDLVRFDLLKKFCAVELKPIILIRDARGVAASALKWKPELPVQHVLSGWETLYKRARPLFTQDGALVVNYENLASDPTAERRRIADYLGLDAGSFENEIVPSEQHLVAGNPMRYQKGVIHIKADEKWKQRLSDEQTALAEQSNGTMRKLYGLESQ